MNQKKSDKPWFIYLIKNKLKQLYCGITVDPERRFFEHASNHPKCAKALKGKSPLSLMYCAQLETQSEALKLELWLKKQSRQYKDKLISGATRLPIGHDLIETKSIQAKVMTKIRNVAKP
jgi:putative endonuclease